MTKKRQPFPVHGAKPDQFAHPAAPGIQVHQVKSLLDAMQDGNEYGSIVSAVMDGEMLSEVRRGIAEIEAVRQRPCLCYAANVVRPTGNTAIDASDYLPFVEMVSQVDPAVRAVDILLATPGGSVEQVNLFVDALRPRFDEVDFIIPYKAMSAGTLWALSGNRIWMDERAFLGPVDPQVPSSDGMFVPAQALIALMNRIQKEGQDALARGEQPPWTFLQLLRHMDQRQLGAAISASQYVVRMAAQYLNAHKFRDWTLHNTHNPGAPVTAAERQQRAEVIANALCSHERWQAHGHAISRDVLLNELKIQIDRPETVPGLLRAIRRSWTLLYYLFDKLTASKVFISRTYAMVRVETSPQRRAP